MNQCSITKVENEIGKTESDCAINSIDYTFMWTTQQDWNTAMFHLIDATAIGEDFTLGIFLTFVQNRNL